jgi:hypothetical protein
MGMTQSSELSAEIVAAPKPRRGARRVTKAETRVRIVRRGMEAAADPVVAHERRMTMGLRTSIGVAITGMTLFFHAPLGAALTALFN